MSPDSVNVIVGIGRNVGSEPMPPSRWLAFCEATHHAIVANGGSVECEVYGTARSKWGEEHTALYCGTIPPWRVNDLRAMLARRAAEYGQECIALTVGETSFVPAHAPPVVEREVTS